MNNNLENWLPIKDYPDYAISDKGRIFSFKSGRYLNCSKRKNYKRVRLNNKFFSIYRLVFLTFNNLPLNHEYNIHHINEIKDDDRLENLQLIEHGEHLTLHKTGLKYSEETRKKISEIQKGRKLSEETKNKISESNKGKKRSLDFCKKMSIISKGEKNNSSKFTNSEVVELRKIINSGLYKLKDIAKVYKISINTIYDIKNERTWKHIL